MKRDGFRRTLTKIALVRKQAFGRLDWSSQQDGKGLCRACACQIELRTDLKG